VRKADKMAEIQLLLEKGYYLTSKQAALYLGLSTRTLADYRSLRRKPEFIKRGNDIRYPAEAVLAYKHYQKNYRKLLSTTPDYSQVGYSESAEFL
jgi:hypothetical protein